MRAHASWGSLNDAMLVFMNQDAYDKFRLSKEDYELQKELEKEQKEVAGDKTDDNFCDYAACIKDIEDSVSDCSENIYFEMQQERKTSAVSLEEKERCFLSGSVERKC